MNSKKVNISMSPFVRAFTFAIVKSIKTRKIVQNRGEIIDAELVPRISQSVLERTLFLPQKKLPEEPFQLSEVKKPIVPRTKEQVMEQRITKPIRMPKPQTRELLQPIIPPRKPRPPMPMQAPAQMAPPQVPQNLPGPKTILPTVSPEELSKGPSKNYGKLQGVLADMSVSNIECSGAGKPIIVVRAGQREFTRIILSPEEIKTFLETVAEAAHIPLMEGVFHAAVDNFTINAVVSEKIGSRFTIKKQTPYDMLKS